MGGEETKSASSPLSLKSIESPMLEHEGVVGTPPPGAPCAATRRRGKGDQIGESKGCPRGVLGCVLKFCEGAFINFQKPFRTKLKIDRLGGGEGGGGDPADNTGDHRPGGGGICSTWLPTDPP